MLNLLGTGSGNSGYGQSPLSSAVVSGEKIRENHWDLLRQDIQRIADHQGTSITITNVATGNKVSATVGTQYSNLITGTLTTNRFNLAVGQYSDESLTSSTRSAGWNSTITHSFNVDFGSFDNARYFFNAGGQIRITPSYTRPSPNNGINASLNDDWFNIVSGVGTVSFDHTSTTGGTIGYYDLTTSWQTIYTRTGGNINNQYTANDYTIRAYRNVSGSIVYFECNFNDDKFCVYVFIQD
jgi:hypothetical protein